MDNWEFLTITFVLITGIGISRLLISFGTMVEARAILRPEKRPKFHWLLLTWMFVTVDVIALSWLMFYKWNLLYEDPRTVLSPLTTLLLLGLASSFYIIMELLSPELSEEGDIDMKRSMEIYRDNGFNGPYMMDHTPRFASGESQRYGKAYANGYIRRLIQEVYS